MLHRIVKNYLIFLTIQTVGYVALGLPVAILEPYDTKKNVNNDFPFLGIQLLNNHLDIIYIIN